MENSKVHVDGCKCGMCQGNSMCGCGRGYGGGFAWGLVRAAVAILMIIIVFWLGMLIGELKVAVRGSEMMRYQMGRTYPVMGGYPGMSSGNTPASSTGL